MLRSDPITTIVREPAVAGRFYPGDAATLTRAVRGYVDDAVLPAELPPVRAVITPHAGYICSGPIAGYSFRALASLPAAAYTVYLLGPAHWAPVHGVGLSSATAFATPLGELPVACDRVAELLARDSLFRLADAAHLPEHCLEVELPFLQTVLPRCSIVPMLCDDAADPAKLAAALAPILAADPYALVVISSDLSHFLPYAEAQQLDRGFLAAVVAGDTAAVRHGQACGQLPILALMAIGQQLHWTARLLHYANSGDTCGPRTGVVGYGAVAFYPLTPIPEA